MVSKITGIPADKFLEVADLFTSVRKDGDMKKAATIIYAVGWTQHTFGTQIIRAAAILQLLLGNVGRAGGGVNALRGHSNIQGATDMAGVFDTLPGYLKMPSPADVDLRTYLDRTTPKPSKPGDWDSFNYWSNTPKFMVSLLKALYGAVATPANDFAYQYLPKIDRKYSWVEIFDGSGKAVVYDLGKTGTERTVTATAPLSVTLGNAPAVAIMINGRAIPPPPAPGAVARFSVGADGPSPRP